MLVALYHTFSFNGNRAFVGCRESDWSLFLGCSYSLGVPFLLVRVLFMQHVGRGISRCLFIMEQRKIMRIEIHL
jgi:hypothetical protein